MSDIVTTIITSAAVGAVFSALVNGVFQIVNKCIDDRRNRKNRAQQKEKQYFEIKEEVYLVALGRLLFIRSGFDYIGHPLSMPNRVKEEIQKEQAEYRSIAPKLRLYATDRIFNMFYSLALWGRYSYADSSRPRLIENSKWAYDAQITLLSRCMKDDLGYRKFDKNVDIIQCPECSREHDFFSACKCGMTFEKLQIKISESLRNAMLV